MCSTPVCQGPLVLVAERRARLSGTLRIAGRAARHKRAKQASTHPQTLALAHLDANKAEQEGTRQKARVQAGHRNRTLHAQVRQQDVVEHFVIHLLRVWRENQAVSETAPHSVKGGETCLGVQPRWEDEQAWVRVHNAGCQGFEVALLAG